MGEGWATGQERRGLCWVRRDTRGKRGYDGGSSWSEPSPLAVGSCLRRNDGKEAWYDRRRKCDHAAPSRYCSFEYGSGLR